MVMGFPPSALGPTSGWRRQPSRLVAAVSLVCAMAGLAHAADFKPTVQADGAHPRSPVEGTPRTPADDSRDPAKSLKAGYLYKFTAFVTWPASAFSGRSSPFRLCVVGHDPFGRVVERAGRGAMVGQHPVVVVRLPEVAMRPACHMLFLAEPRSHAPHRLTGVAARQPTLTVADAGLDVPGAMIQFVEVDGRLRFDIRADAAQAAGLVVSSKLLALAASPSDNGK